MRRLLPTLALTLLAAASCGDQSVLPVSSLAPTSALKDREGDPPPPPVAGDADAFLSVYSFDGGDFQSTADPCEASSSFQFAYKYLLNKPENSAFLHLRSDRGMDVSAHQTDKKLDVKGTLSGSDFTFQITETLEGDIIAPETRVPSTVSFLLVGKLTTEAGTCTANATLTVYLDGFPD